MFNYRLLAVVKRELREKLMSKAFIIMTILLPVVMFGLIGFQTLMVNYKGDKGGQLEIVSESPGLTEACKRDFSGLDFVKDGSWSISCSTLSGDKLESYIDTKKPELLSDKLTGIIFIPDMAFEDKKVDYYAKTPNKAAIFSKVRGPINNLLLDQYFAEKSLTPEELSFARMSVEFNSFKVTKEDKIEKQGIGNIVLAFIFTFLLYLSLLMSGTMTMSYVLEEKTSKVVEVLLSSVSARDLMAGKIFGSTITSLSQMIIWLLPLIILMTTSWFTLPDKYRFDIGPGYIVYFLFNFSLGMLIFQGLFTMAGAIFNDAQESQQGAFPIIMLILIPFFICFSMLGNPDNPIAVVASYVPFAALFVMPVRFTLVDISFIHPLIASIINIATLAVIFPAAGKVYRIGILRTGTKPSLKELIRWIRTAE